MNLALAIPPEVVEAITAEATARAIEALSSGGGDGYLDVDGAADFLACPKSRIYALVSQDAIPVERDGSRLLFSKAKLHEYVRSGGAKRA